MFTPLPFVAAAAVQGVGTYEVLFILIEHCPDTAEGLTTTSEGTNRIKYPLAGIGLATTS